MIKIVRPIKLEEVENSLVVEKFSQLYNTLNRLDMWEYNIKVKEDK